ADRQLALEDQFLGQAVLELHEEFGLTQDLAMPFGTVDAHALLEALTRVFETGPIELTVARHPTDLRLAGASTTTAAIDDPTQDAEVFAEAGPQELASLALAEPVHVEDTRRIGQIA